MSDPAQMHQAVRLIALETVLVHVAKIALVNAGVGASAIQALRENTRAKLNVQTLPGLKPVWSDHLSSELEEAVDDILTDIENAVAAAWKQLGRDPDS